MKCRPIAVMLIVVLLASILLSGCTDTKHVIASLNMDIEKLGETNGLKLPIDKKGTKITYLTVSTVENIQDKLFTRSLNEITGLNVEFLVVPAANAEQKIQRMAASKQLPDIFPSALNYKEIENMALNGALVPIDEHLDKMPNFKKLFLDDEESKKEMVQYTLRNGHIYNVPSYNIARKINHGFLYRKDIFDQHNIKPWTNTEEFYLALKKLKSIYPDSIPFTSKQGTGLFLFLARSWGLTGYGFYYNNEQGKYLYGPTDIRFKNMLDFFRKLYAEELIDPEFLTCSQASWTAKMTHENKSFVTFDWIDRMDMFYEQMKDTNPEFDLRFGYPIGPEMKYNSLKKVSSGGVVITDNDKKDLSLQLVDFLISPAGSALSTLGIEGQSYEFDSEDRVNYLGFSGYNSLNIKDLENKFGLFIQGAALRYDDRCIYYQYSPKNQEAQDLVVNHNLLAPTGYDIRLMQGEEDKFTELYAELEKETIQFLSEYIIGKNSGEDAWQGWLQKAKSLGVDELTRIYQKGIAQYDQLLNNLR